MNVALLLVTHQNIASSLINITTSIVNESVSNTDYIEVPMDAPLEHMEQEINQKLKQLNRKDGAIILTDMFGGTPSNLACKFNRLENTNLISGLNLPMLVKVMNYRHLPLDELTDKALSGGRESICLHEDSIN